MTQPDPAGAARPEERVPVPPLSSEPPQIVPVEGKAALDRFIRVPWHIYADDPNWVPPLMIERRDHLNTAATGPRASSRRPAEAGTPRPGLSPRTLRNNTGRTATVMS